MSTATPPDRPPSRPTPQVTLSKAGMLHHVWADYRYALRYKGEPRGRAAALLPIRMLLNPSLQLALLTRVAQFGPRLLWHPVRWIMVALYSSEIYWFRGDEAIKLGPGISFPHPINVIIGPGTVIGSRVTIFNNTSIGSSRRWSEGQDLIPPVIGDDVLIGPYTALMGGYHIGEGAQLGMQQVVSHDVPAGALLLRTGMRGAGTWSEDFTGSVKSSDPQRPGPTS